MKKLVQVFVLILIIAFAVPFNSAQAKDKKVTPTNNMPKTMEEYYKEAKKQSERSTNVPSPQFKEDDAFVNLPKPEIGLRKYNNPPGLVEINLKSLKSKHKINSTGVASPDGSRMAYTTVYYYPTSRTAGSELYLMKLDTSKNLKDRITDAHINTGVKPIYKTGMDALDLNVEKTLTILDWSADGRFLAIKEKISYSQDGLWQTNLLVYDFAAEKMRNLSEVREAIKYYWKKNEGLDLSQYRWDIFPVGWDALNNDRILVFAYAYTGQRPRFLGSWSIDYTGDRSMLLSVSNAKFDVTQNGVSLKVIAD